MMQENNFEMRIETNLEIAKLKRGEEMNKNLL